MKPARDYRSLIIPFVPAPSKPVAALPDDILEIMDRVAQKRLDAKFPDRTITEIRGPSRKAELVRVRHWLMAQLYAEGWAMGIVADYLNRHHSDVHHALKYYPEARKAHALTTAPRPRPSLLIPPHLKLKTEN